MNAWNWCKNRAKKYQNMNPSLFLFSWRINKLTHLFELFCFMFTFLVAHGVVVGFFWRSTTFWYLSIHGISCFAFLLLLISLSEYVALCISRNGQLVRCWFHSIAHHAIWKFAFIKSILTFHQSCVKSFYNDNDNNNN